MKHSMFHAIECAPPYRPLQSGESHENVVTHNRLEFCNGKDVDDNFVQQKFV
jgi:hypothetical protein